MDWGTVERSCTPPGAENPVSFEELPGPKRAKPVHAASPPSQLVAMSFLGMAFPAGEESNKICGSWRDLFSLKIVQND